MLDASMTMSWRFASEETPFSRTVLVALRDTYAEVPAVWLMEIAKVLAMGERRKRITLEESKAFQLTLSLSDVRVEPLWPVGKVAELLVFCRKHSLTAYDAAYLDLARRKRLQLATFDKDSVRAAPLKGVALFGRPNARAGCLSALPRRERQVDAPTVH